MREDVSFIDNVLHLAASLRIPGAVPEGQPSRGKLDGMRTSSGAPSTPAGSLLARGSAADLQIVQNGALYPIAQGTPPTAQLPQYEEGLLKRKRPHHINNSVTQHCYELNSHDLQQRLSSRDAMPPPLGRLLNMAFPNGRGQSSSSGHQIYNQAPMTGLTASRGNWHHPDAHADVHSLPNTQHPTLPRPGTGPEDGFSGIHESTGPVTTSFLWRQQESDGELDQNTHSSISRPRSRPSSISPTKRLTLPPRTPSIVNHATPRRQVGISANIRRSQPPFPTPESSRSLQDRLSRRAPGGNSQPAASPYFSHRTLPANRIAQSPYATVRQTLPRPQQASTMTPKISHSVQAPTSSAPGKFSWLTASFAHDQHQNQQRSTTAGIQDGSGAFRQPGGPRRSTDQRLPVNSFSFTDQPQLENGNRGRNLGVPYANHGRRAARR